MIDQTVCQLHRRSKLDKVFAVKIDQVRTFALTLPEVTEAPHHHLSSFRVSGKIFVTVPPDGRYIHVFVGEEQRVLALMLAPEFIEKLLWGEKVVGLRIALAMAKPALVKQLIAQSWQAKAPKVLLANQVTAPKQKAMKHSEGI